MKNSIQSRMTYSVWFIICSVLLTFTLYIGYALAKSSTSTALTALQIKMMVPTVNAANQLTIAVTPEVVAEVNRMHQHVGMHLYMQGVLKRMQTYLPMIKPALIKNQVPLSFMALPMIESGYKLRKGPIAGLWQITAATARHLGLVVHGKQDDRLNPQRDTNAAIAYLKELYAEYHDWNLTLVAYNIGSIKTNALIKATGSHDMWVLARSSHAPAQLKRFLTAFSTAVIIMNNPSLVK